MGTQKEQPKDKDSVFSVVALGLSQQVFSNDVARVFTNHKWGVSLLTKSKS